MIGLMDLFIGLIYACLYLFVLALWAAFFILIICPIVCMIVMLVLGLVLGAVILLINLVLYFDPSSSTLLEPCKTAINDFGEFIFPLVDSFMEHIRKFNDDFHQREYRQEPLPV